MARLKHQLHEEVKISAPLFDRLIDENPKETAEQDAFRTLSAEKLEASIQREVSLILNTRRRDRKGALTPNLPQNFGFPDFSTFNPNSEEGWLFLAQQMKQTIEAFEPRLKHVRIKVLKAEGARQALTVEISGVVTLYPRPEPITFPVEITLPVAGGA